MKTALLTFFVIFLVLGQTYSQTYGTLTFTATTSSAGGNYAPKNIVAVWIEDNQGNFVKTLLAYAQTRKTHLNTWEATTTAAGSPFNTVDAITGATKSSHGLRTCSWNGTDVSGTLVADGTYKIRMELTDKNNTGNFSTFTFSKGPNAENQTPANVPSFASIIINWEPVFTSVQDPELDNLFQAFPNPTYGTFRISGPAFSAVNVFNQSGAIVFNGQSSVIDISNLSDGIYYLQITTEKGTAMKKILKK
jgi:hypothetical protein